jgi:hypothetical protein
VCTRNAEYDNLLNGTQMCELNILFTKPINTN